MRLNLVAVLCVLLPFLAFALCKLCLNNESYNPAGRQHIQTVNIIIDCRNRPKLCETP